MAGEVMQNWRPCFQRGVWHGWIIRAASQAQKAADYILNIQPEVQP